MAACAAAVFRARLAGGANRYQDIWCRITRVADGVLFQGLNFLLNEQPDKAIEAFNDVVKVDRRQ